MIDEVSSSIDSPTQVAQGVLSAVMCFPASLKVFSGHFPTHSLVPAVYLIEAARQLSTGLLHATGQTSSQITYVRDARFTAEVLPDTRLEVEVKAHPAGQDTSFQARFTIDQNEVARIRIDFAQP